MRVASPLVTVPPAAAVTSCEPGGCGMFPVAVPVEGVVVALVASRVPGAVAAPVGVPLEDGAEVPVTANEPALVAPDGEVMGAVPAVAAVPAAFEVDGRLRVRLGGRGVRCAGAGRRGRRDRLRPVGAGRACLVCRLTRAAHGRRIGGRRRRVGRHGGFRGRRH